MREKKGALIVHALGTTNQGLPVTLVGAQVKIYDTSEAAEPAEGQSGRRPSSKCVATGLTGPNGRYVFPLPEGEYEASATFGGEGETRFPNKIHVCEGASVEVTINIPTDIKVYTSQTHCEDDYAESDLCHLFYKRPTYVKIIWPAGLLKRFALVASGATIRSLRSPAGSGPDQTTAYFSVTPTGQDVLVRAAASRTDVPPDQKVSPDDEGVISASAAQPDVTPVEGDLSVSLKRSASFETRDIALWSVIRRAHNAISFDRYMDFMNWIFCGEPGHPGHAPYSGSLRFVNARRFLPFTDTDAYRNLKAATEAFLMANACVYDTARNELSYIADHVAISQEDLTDPQTLFDRYTIGPDKMLPYLAVIRAKLSDQRLKDNDIGDINLGDVNFDNPPSDSVDACYGILREKLRCPCLLELIWSYWNEEGMLVQTMNVITRRFQNMRGSLANDPLANLEIDPLRPLNNLIWGWVQDEQHRLSVVRRNYEYDHHYGLRLAGKAVDNARTADSRSKFLEAFHTLLSILAAFYKRDDDTTMVADGFPVLNALKEAHLILSQGAHNQFGDLPTTARIEMLMQQWILARPEFREFIPTRIMVAYPEPWMDRVDAMKKLQGWTDTSILHFRNLAIFGEQIILGVRYGNWNSVYEPVFAVNWARYWRSQVQGYLHAYRSVTGVDLSIDVTNARIDATMPSALLVKRLAEQRQRV
jgi:hypothetical protein